MNYSIGEPLKVGIVGGGQLGQMLIQNAINWNLDIYVLDADAQAPCRHIAKFTQGAITDYETVINFGTPLDLLTIEIENVSTEALSRLAMEGKKVYPQPSIVELIRNKARQKEFYSANGIASSAFQVFAGKEELINNYQGPFPCVQKLAVGGYDGKGVQVLKSAEELKAKAWDGETLIEEFVPIAKEISIIVCRSSKGEIASFEPAELVYHEQNLVDYLLAPANIEEDKAKAAQHLAENLAEKLGIVGLLAVELFITKEGSILVNEVAPRPHNSGHHSIEACYSSQFEMHWRAILGLPLGSCKLHHHAAMLNIIGEEGKTGIASYLGTNEVLLEEGAYLHLYGKAQTKPFRKMGHITLLANSREELMLKLEKLKNKVYATLLIHK